MAIPGLSLPGLSLNEPPSVSSAYSEAQPTAPVHTPRTITLAPNTELRLELSTNAAPLSLKLLPTFPSTLAPTSQFGPTAEIFGTELSPAQTYNLPGGTKCAVYTHHGAQLELLGDADTEYISEETCYSEYVNLCFALDNSRAAGEGPRVLLLGAADSGKTSLAKTLVAYTLRMDRGAPMIVNLDPSEGVLSLPGCLSTAVFGSGAILDVEDVATRGWGTSAVAGAAGVPVKNPLVYHFGHAKPEEKSNVFKAVSTRLAVAATGRYEADKDAKLGGIIIDMAASSVGSGRDKEGYDIVSHVVSEFSVNVVVVIGNEKLHNDMQRKFDSTKTTEEKVTVVKVSKNGGCVDRDEHYRKTMSELQIRNYFFGSLANPLSPHTTTVDFSAMTVLEFARAEGTAGTAGDTRFAPGGGEDDDDEDDYEPPDYEPAQGQAKDAIFRKTQPSISMNNGLLVLKHASIEDTDAIIRDAPVMGYLFFADVDEAKRKVKILSPVGGRLPLQHPLVFGRYPSISSDFQV